MWDAQFWLHMGAIPFPLDHLNTNGHSTFAARPDSVLVTVVPSRYLRRIGSRITLLVFVASRSFTTRAFDPRSRTLERQSSWEDESEQYAVGWRREQSEEKDLKRIMAVYFGPNQ